MARPDSQTASPAHSPPAAAATIAAPSAPARRWKLVLAFGCIYVIWGSTYLAIRFAIETLPPFSMLGLRFVLAGGLLYGWARLAGGAQRPTHAHWRTTAIVGALLLVGGNGLVV